MPTGRCWWGRTGRHALEVDANRLARALREQPDRLVDLLFAESEEDGFDGIVSGVGAYLQGLGGTLRSLLGGKVPSVCSSTGAPEPVAQ